MSDTLSHLAGPRIVVSGRIVQRCSVCGAKLADSEGCAMPLRADGTPDVFPTWPEGRVIQVEAGNPTRYSVLPDTDKLPPDACVDFI